MKQLKFSYFKTLLPVYDRVRKYTAGTCVAIVGSGREENRNNSYPHAAGLAQPSGIVVVQEYKIAFLADSESSAIRKLHLDSGQVSAICGGDKNPTVCFIINNSPMFRYICIYISYLVSYTIYYIYMYVLLDKTYTNYILI